MATDLCLPILKYSHATGVRSDNSIPWTHLQASDIFAIVIGSKANRLDEQLSLKVVQGNKCLESIDIAYYVDAAIDARRGAEQHGVTPQVEQLPIFGITKDALLALRYRPSDGQARRIQLRMENATHCRQIVDAFIRRGMEFQEQRPRPGTVRPTTAAGQERPSSAASSSPYFASNQAHPTSPERSPIQAPYHYQHASQEMPPPSSLSRDEIAAPREPVPSRPGTAQIYRSYTTPSQPAMYDSQELARRPSDPTGEPFSSISRRTSTLAAIREAVDEGVTPPRTATDMPPPAPRPSHWNENWSSGTPDRTAFTNLSSEPAERPQSARPSTSASSMPAPDLDHELPPVRELPFKRPDRKRSRSGGRSPGALTMPPLPKPKLVKQGSGSPLRADSLSPTKEALDPRSGTASPLKRTYYAADDEVERAQTAVQTRDVAWTTASRETSLTKPARTPQRGISPGPSACKPSRMDELLARKPLSDRSSNAHVPRNDSLTDAPGVEVSPPHSPSKHIGSSRQHDPDDDADAALRKAFTRPPEVSVEEYATQSLPDREAALEEFMIANLENPAFTKLCEDVENCWRRIALGL